MLARQLKHGAPDAAAITTGAEALTDFSRTLRRPAAADGPVSEAGGPCGRAVGMPGGAWRSGSWRAGSGLPTDPWDPA